MKLVNIVAATAMLGVVAGSAFAGDTPETTIEPLKIVKSTQAPVSLGLGGLGVGGLAAVLGGILAIAVIGASTSGT